MKKAIPHIAKFALNTGMDVVQNKSSLKNALVQRGKEAVTNLMHGSKKTVARPPSQHRPKKTLARAPPPVASRLAGKKRSNTKSNSNIKKKRMGSALHS